MKLPSPYTLWLNARYGGRVKIGTRSSVSSRSTIAPGKGGEIAIGKRAEIHPGSMILAYGSEISIGDDFSLNPYSILYGSSGGLTIGNGVRVAAHVVIMPANHVFTDPDRPIHRQGATKLGITIEDDVWIGANVSILDGAHISRGCVIAAGAVVRGKTEPMAVYGGVPARVIKRRLPSYAVRQNMTRV